MITVIDIEYSNGNDSRQLMVDPYQININQHGFVAKCGTIILVVDLWLRLAELWMADLGSDDP